MSPKLKCHQNWNFTTTEMSTKTKMSQKLKCYQNWNVIKTKISPKIKWNQKNKFTKNEMSPKLKCYQNLNVTSTEMSKNLKSPQNQNFNHNQNPWDQHLSPWWYCLCIIMENTSDTIFDYSYWLDDTFCSPSFFQTQE